MTAAVATAVRGLGRLQPARTVFFACDVQERFRDMIHCMPHVIATSQFLVKAAKEMQIPCVVTEQYPKGLLHTVKEIDVSGLPVFEKTKFSMLTDEVNAHLATLGEERRTAVVFGIEAHVCVFQTCLDLVDSGWDVHVVADGVSSSKKLNRDVALERLKQAGVWVTSAESLLFDLMRDTSYPHFKAISGLVKDQNSVLKGLSASL
mmetsp:Transcript_10044/g.25422  ORF Transcript_10044/g.25422 Transcript_10044/m.25422 type:complete len:205 (-) Transcript_10044:566-1180(-)